MVIKIPRLAVKRTKVGLGLIALEKIPAGKRIVEYQGTVLSEDDAEEKGGKFLYDLSNNRALDGSSRSNRARYINHSCSPNALAKVSRNRVWIWSLREIEVGEEITMDYGREYFEQYIKPKGCRCLLCEKKPRKNP
jgi:SET domain-containing protein